MKRAAILAILAMFQFPTNGKAYPKLDGRIRQSSALQQVSIPYEREGISKELRIGTGGYRSLVSIPYEREGISKVIQVLGLEEVLESFNSLRTGRHIQRQ